MEHKVLQQINSKSISGTFTQRPKHPQPTKRKFSQPFPTHLFKTTCTSHPFPIIFVEYLQMKNSQQPLPPPFFLQSHRNPITYFTSSAASKVPFSHVTYKNALAAGCSKTRFHLTCMWVRIQGYNALRYYSKYKVTLNPTFLSCSSFLFYNLTSPSASKTLDFSVFFFHCSQSGL